MKIGFGGAALSGDGGGYGFGAIEDPIGLVKDAFERGISLYDTAPIYGYNQSEITLGQALKSVREKVEIVSKSGVSWHESKRVNMTNDPVETQKMLENSLRNLNTEYIDIYMIHWPDDKVDIRKPLEVLAKAQSVGKIKSIGLCNTYREDLLKSLEICKIEYIQGESNLFKNFQHGLNNLITEHQIKTMGWGTFDKGILAGSVKEDSKFEDSDARSWAPWWKKSNWKERVKKAELIEKKIGKSIKDIALQYSLVANDISLCGVKKRHHLDYVFDMLDQSIDQEIISAAVDVARS